MLIEPLVATNEGQHDSVYLNATLQEGGLGHRAPVTPHPCRGSAKGSKRVGLRNRDVSGMLVVYLEGGRIGDGDGEQSMVLQLKVGRLQEKTNNIIILRRIIVMFIIISRVAAAQENRDRLHSATVLVPKPRCWSMVVGVESGTRVRINTRDQGSV